MTKSTSQKISIALTSEQAGSFDISAENLWFTKKGDAFQLKNIPLFVDNIAYDDEVELVGAGDRDFKIGKIFTKSENSTVVVLFKKHSSPGDFIERIKSIGCGIEGGAFEGYYAINVPKSVHIEKCYFIIDFFEKRGDLVADYPCIRQ